jgi:hypothetical protein
MMVFHNDADDDSATTWGRHSEEEESTCLLQIPPQESETSSSFLPSPTTQTLNVLSQNMDDLRYDSLSSNSQKKNPISVVEKEKKQGTTSSKKAMTKPAAKTKSKSISTTKLSHATNKTSTTTTTNDDDDNDQDKPRALVSPNSTLLISLYYFSCSCSSLCYVSSYRRLQKQQSETIHRVHTIQTILIASTGRSIKTTGFAFPYILTRTPAASWGCASWVLPSSPAVEEDPIVVCCIRLDWRSNMESNQAIGSVGHSCRPSNRRYG